MGRVCVFASSSPRTPPAYLDAAAQIGRLLAERDLVCVNGAGRTGCMGALNDACLAAGGRVEGVILRKFLDEQLEHRGLHSMAVCDTMRERKRLLGQGVDGYLVLPGGPGTWEEFWEVAVERQIDTHNRPLVIVNTDGYYDGFLQQAARGHADGMLYGPVEELFVVAEAPEAAVDHLTPSQGGGR